MPRLATVAFGVLALAAIARAQATPETVSVYNVFREYVDAVMAGDRERAASFWRTEDVAAASRLAITREGGALKLDDDSPLWRLAPEFRGGTATYKFGPVEALSVGPFAGQRTLTFRGYVGSDRLIDQYLFQRGGARGWSLASGERWLAEQGPRSTGRYVTVFERRPGYPWTLPPHLVANLDAAVAHMAGRLDLGSDRLDLLAREKLHYLLVAPDVVSYLARAETVGYANRQVDMVVTSHPHHAHELAHLLVDVWLGSTTAATLPLLQEGLATHLGGRSGRAGRVLDRVGRAILADGTVTLADLLTARGFRRHSADLAYPAAGVFAGFLLDGYGSDGLRAACRAVSGSPGDVAGWSAGEVGRRLGDAVGVSWPVLAARFADHLDSGRTGARLLPADVRTIRDADAREFVAGDQRVTFAPAAGDDAHLLRAEGAPVHCSLLFGGGAADAAPCALFAEHFPGRPYRGETHALILTSADARLYDYRRQELVALHSEGFWPTRDGNADARLDGGLVGLWVAPGVLPFDTAIELVARGD
jgi:hypothetical protein